MTITELIITITEDIPTMDKYQLMLMLHLTNLITQQVKQYVPSYIFDLQIIVSVELLKRGIAINEL